ncbi:uncharacterized protein LOC122639795 [Telopea speciosissima]|uniref:uncharacterized protein LOC122639795 n=1 Tax=Telopea speciosissima TaxID=54955 RepID=UPI001CC5A370|nr:uncharacterized protein LOC122639795 [Telopea speciosissima]XP_043688704.1 uncharacterized protein LOC122639795 [Telopea speciosissima]XP_043688705.1 uncharacterized protein LOC122639795 [Telopea speciosissima]
MGLVKIHHWIAVDSSNSRHISHFPSLDGLGREDKEILGMDSGDDSDDCKIAEVGCEVGTLDGQMCSIPYELYDLPDLKEILSLETWNSCLTDDDRLSLSAFLPDMDQQTFWLTMKDLLAGNEMFFGSPLGEFFERLKSGFYPPKVTHLREGLQFLQRRTYYHFLKSYHENMCRTFLDMKRVWNLCQPSINVEERIHIWRTKKNDMRMDPFDLNAYPLDGDLLSKEVSTKTVVCPLSKKTKYIDSEGSNTHHFPPVPNGMKLVVAPNTSAKGVLKIKPVGMNSFQTHLPKSVFSDSWPQCRPAPKGVLKIVPKGISGRQEQQRKMLVQAEPTQLIEAPVLQMSRFSPSTASLYRWDTGEHDEESPFLHQTVGGRKAYRNPELPDCITDRERVEFLSNTIGSSRNLESSIRKPKRVKDQSFDAITDLHEHKLFGGDPGPWNSDEGSPKGGHRLSRNPVDIKRYSCEDESPWQNFGRESIESSQSSLEPYTFSAEYYQGKRHMAPSQQEHSTMYPRISEVVSRPLDVSIREGEMLKTSLDRSKRHRDVGLGGSHKPHDPLTISEGFRDGIMFPITYKRRKAQTKLNSLDLVKPLTAGADLKSATLKEANHHIGESAKAVKIKFKNWKDKSIDKQGISNGLQHGSPSA